jgi:hypothetical protein
MGMRRASLTSLVLAVASMALASSAAQASPVPVKRGWARYVLDRDGRPVYPRRVTVLSTPGTVLHPRGLARPGGEATILRSGAQLVVDLGIDTGGWVRAAVRGAHRGPVVLSYSESARYLQPGGDMQGGGSIGKNDGHNGRSDLIRRRGRFKSRGLRGAERYILIQLPRGRFSIDALRVDTTHLAVGPGDYSGHFLSSSRLLNRIWYAGAYTLDLDTANDPRRGQRRFRLIDGAKRDRLVWLGDLAMEALAGRYTVGRLGPVIDGSLRLFACQQLPDGYIPMASDVNVRCPRRPGRANGPPASVKRSLPGLAVSGSLPGYTAWWVIAVCNRFALTGDAAGTRPLLPVMRRAMGYFDAHAPSGLFETPLGAINWRVFDRTPQVDTYTNELWAQALGALAGVEGRIGSAAEAAQFRAMAAAVQTRLRAQLFDISAGMFVGGAGLADHPQDANVGAVLSGTVQNDAARQLLTTTDQRLESQFGPLTSDLANDPYVEQYVSPYMSGWQLIAELRQHQGLAARSLLERLWGRMVDSDPRSTLWEAMAADGTPKALNHGAVYPGRTSLAHGWSTAPVYALSAYVLGMRPRTPGWRTWIVEPQTIGLRFAQGQVRTPLGPLRSRWVSRTGAFKLTVDAPRGTHGTVALPVESCLAFVSEDGHPVKHSCDDGYARVRTRGGEHTFEARRVAPPRRAP